MVAASATGAQVTVERVTAETVHYQIVHWMPGRFRIKIPKLGWDEEYSGKLKYLVDSLNFVTSTRINPAAHALIVEYRHEPSATAIATVQEKLFRVIQEASYAKVDSALVAASGEEKKANNEIDWVERLGFPVAGLVLSSASLLGAPIPPPIDWSGCLYRRDSRISTSLGSHSTGSPIDDRLPGWSGDRAAHRHRPLLRTLLYVRSGGRG